VSFVLLAPGEAPPRTTKIALDLEAVATHEAGHVLGLAHNCGTGFEAWPADETGRRVPACDGSDPSVAAATMFFRVDSGDTSKRRLAPADVAGGCALVRQLSCERAVDGGCSTSSGSPSWIVLAGLAACLRRRARRRDTAT
jgi:hypothetical protein